MRENLLTDDSTTMTAQGDHAVTTTVLVHVILLANLTTSYTLQPKRECER